MSKFEDMPAHCFVIVDTMGIQVTRNCFYLNSILMLYCSHYLCEVSKFIRERWCLKSDHLINIDVSR